ncbi:MULTISPECIES: ATP-dependent RNA helicase [Corynebacterium]|uniref:ATP-dependent RNA helicase n=1 Tax=Corynebacterium TaxID=1716 RepID=UPI001CE3E329|nr:MULTISPECIES: ATP-dependent helicase C-terminal domain-containing protein [Corynebacterium]
MSNASTPSDNPTSTPFTSTNSAPFDLESIGAGLPVFQSLGELWDILDNSTTAVIQAPPGTGKTTLIPPAVSHWLHANHIDGTVIVTAPRRVAVRAAARRLGHLSGPSTLGTHVGYSIKGEHTPGDLVEFVTPGVLLRRLLADPSLDGVAAVIIDEVHERQLDTDLVLAMCIELAQLREDFRLLAMSATLNSHAFASLLATGTTRSTSPILSTPAVTHPLDITYQPHPGRAECTREFLHFLADQAIQAVEQHHRQHSALVFVPGQREIEIVARHIEERSTIEVRRLHGGLASKEQDNALRNTRNARIIVSTSIAESSLTVPGVRIVVDSGLSRVPRRDNTRQMTGLVTLGCAQSTADQRAGRAGREGPGTVIRAYSAADYSNAAPDITAEILTSDLSDAALVMLSWGAGADFPLPDAPADAAMTDAIATLTSLGAVEGAEVAAGRVSAGSGVGGVGRGSAADGHDAPGGSGAGFSKPPSSPGGATPALARAGGAMEKLHELRITNLGRALALLPVDPRLGRALLMCGPAAADVVASLADSPRGDLGQLAAGVTKHANRRKAHAQEARRLRAMLASLNANSPAETQSTSPSNERPDGSHGSHAASSHTDETSASHAGATYSPQSGEFWGEREPGVVTALAYPQRIARRVGTTDEYLLAQGTRATLPADLGLSGAPWLAIADVSRSRARTHSASATIRAAARLSERDALRILPVRETLEATVEGGALRGRKIRTAGAIELSSTPCALPKDDAVDALAQHIRQHGLTDFPMFELSAQARQLRDRVNFLHAQLGAPWPDLGKDFSTLEPLEWLGPELEAIAGGSRAAVDMHAALQRVLPWPEALELDSLAPANVEVPSGSHPAVDYSTGRPVLKVKLQECFGLVESPEYAGMKVQFHLLSPAGRPLAVTDDLASFWSGAYRGVRADMRGRYPKHPWPEDPWNAVATSKTKKRL